MIITVFVFYLQTNQNEKRPCSIEEQQAMTDCVTAAVSSDKIKDFYSKVSHINTFRSHCSRVWVKAARRAEAQRVQPPPPCCFLSAEFLCIMPVFPQMSPLMRVCCHTSANQKPACTCASRQSGWYQCCVWGRDSSSSCDVLLVLMFVWNAVFASDSVEVMLK